jgi:serine/threonine protein kinase/tetratricopeptide (TPR) repeat protein
MPGIDFKHPRYQLNEPLGRGGMGAVWEAIDLETNELVAIKLLREGSLADRRLFEGEVRILGELRHENIVRLLDAGALGDRLFLVMERLRGHPLDEFLDQPKPGHRQIDHLLRITTQVLLALEYIHDRGIIHGDLKPSNIMVLEPTETSMPMGENGGSSSPDANPAIKVLDFGLARTSNRLTRGSLSEISSGRQGADDGGTPLYMAPEQLASTAATERSDLYSLGALLYHLIAGRPPFDSLAAALTRKPAPPSLEKLNKACAPKLARTILSFMEEAQHKRPSTAAEAASMLTDAGSLAAQKPSASPRLMRPVFIGRERERGLILQKLEDVREHGALQSLRLVGAGGCGKSWLLHSSGLKAMAEFDSEAHTLETSFRQERNGRGGLGRILLGNRDSDYSPGFRRRFSVDVKEEAPPGTPTERDSRESSNDQVVAEAAQALRSLARRQPLLLILEDIQFATEAEIDLLTRLAAVLSDSPILLLLSYRDEDHQPGSLVEKLGERLDGSGHPQPLRLGGLDDNALREYAEAVLSPRLPAAPELLETLATRSGGNPLALHQALGQLVAEGSLARDSGRWNYTGKAAGVDSRKKMLLPPGSLSSAQQSVLIAAGVINETFDQGLLACLLEGEDENRSTPEATASLVTSGLLLEDSGGYRLAPGLELDELLNSIPRKQAKRLHERLARLLLELNPALGTRLRMRIAEHFELAGAGEDAFNHYLDAARSGAKDYSNQLSRKAYEKALELAPGNDRQDILRELGSLHLSCGELQSALDCLLQAERNAANRPDSDRAGLWNDIARTLHRQGKLDEAKEYFDRCLSIAGEDTHALAKTCYGLAGLFFDQRDLGRARKHFQKSLKLYGEGAPPRNLVPLHLGLALIERLENNPERSIARFKEALDLARKTGQLLDIARIQSNLANTYRTLGEMSAALEHLEESTRIRKLTGDRQGLAICLNSLARIQTQRGEFQAALETTESALEIFEEVGDPKGIAITLCNIGELLLLRGRPREAREALERCSRLDDENDGTPLACNILFNQARVEVAVCEYERAENLFQECLRRLPEGREQELETHALAGLAEVFLKKEMFEAAEDALQEARGVAQDGGGPESASELLGLRMRLCRKRGEFEQVIDLGCTSDDNEVGPYETARRALELGAAYRDLGPDWADKTEKYLERSIREFEKMGCPVETAEALGELSLYWQLTGEEEEALELLRRAEAILSAGQLGPRRSRFTETFKTRLQ